MKCSWPYTELFVAAISSYFLIIDLLARADESSYSRDGGSGTKLS